MPKDPKYFKSVDGWNGVMLRKLIEQIFDVKPHSYKWLEDEKTFVFYIENKAIQSEGALAWKHKLERDRMIYIVGT